MPAVVRKGDICSGHGTFPPRPNIQGSPDVTVDGIPAHRQGDGWAVHCNPVPICHASTLQSGSSTVFVNGKELGRIGDPVACGSVCAQGSPTVWAGG